MLKHFAREAPDLRKILTPERIRKYQAEGAGLTLCYATEQVTKEILDRLLDLASEKRVMHWMRALQAGEKVNGSENRPALHTALRLKKGAKQLSSEALQAAEFAWAELDRLENFLPTVDTYTDIVQVGIGGSSLGPEAIYHALKAYAIPRKRAHFIANIDPDDAVAIFKNLPLSKTLFVIVSKSGSTLETVTNEAIIRAELIQAGLDPVMHLIAVTGKGSPMDDPEKYRAAFYIWDFVGGRYSTTSMVGAVLLSFILGFEVFLQFLDGAYAMDQVALRENPAENLPLLGALIGVWNRTFLGYPTVAVVPYSQALARFPAHLEQLDMESNGKRTDKEGRVLDFTTGPIVWGEPGTNGQHSFFQQIHQGTTVIPVEFIGFQQCQYGHDLLIEGSTSQEKLNGNMLAQALALALGQAGGKTEGQANQEFPGNRPSQLLLGKRCDAVTVGALLAYYEHKVAFQGFLWGINSFDQPGVELGKKLATQMIASLAKKRNGEKISDPIQQAFIDLFN
jgi:glucose-6-phosphate isomerase